MSLDRGVNDCDKDELKCRLCKCDSHNQQLEAKLQEETSKLELLQADLAQIKTVSATYVYCSKTLTAITRFCSFLRENKLCLAICIVESMLTVHCSEPLFQPHSWLQCFSITPCLRDMLLPSQCFLQGSWMSVIEECRAEISKDCNHLTVGQISHKMLKCGLRPFYTLH